MKYPFIRININIDRTTYVYIWGRVALGLPVLNSLSVKVQVGSFKKWYKRNILAPKPKKK